MRFLRSLPENPSSVSDRIFPPCTPIMKGKSSLGGERVTVLYVDTLFILNALIDYLLLLVSARVAGRPLRRLRFVLGAALGGGYAVAMFLPGFAFLSGGGYKLLIALLMLLLAYGAGPFLLRQSLIFFTLSCALAGGIAAIGMLDGGGLSLGRGVVYSVPDVKVVLLSAAGCYALLSALLSRLGRHTTLSGELVPVRITLLGRSVELTGLTDTGNTLTDPLTGESVPVAEGAALANLFPAGVGDLTDPAAALERLSVGEMRGRYRLLPYRAVGVERGLLLAVRMDEVAWKGRARRGRLVALSPTPVSDGGGYQVLMGGENA